MTWTLDAQNAADDVVLRLWTETARRYGENTALMAEDEAIYCIEAHAEDLARAACSPVVTAAHVAEAAGMYQYHPSLSDRLAGIALSVRRLVVRVA